MRNFINSLHQILLGWIMYLPMIYLTTLSSSEQHPVIRLLKDNESERLWSEASRPNLTNFRSICLEGMRKTTATSVRRACRRVEIWNRYLPPNMKHGCQPLGRYVVCGGVIRLRRMRWARHIAYMGNIKVKFETLKGGQIITETYCKLFVISKISCKISSVQELNDCHKTCNEFPFKMKWYSLVSQLLSSDIEWQAHQLSDTVSFVYRDILF
jgi:hypothetical protein